MVDTAPRHGCDRSCTARQEKPNDDPCLESNGHRRALREKFSLVPQGRKRTRWYASVNQIEAGYWGDILTCDSDEKPTCSRGLRSHAQSRGDVPGSTLNQCAGVDGFRLNLHADVQVSHPLPPPTPRRQCRYLSAAPRSVTEAEGSKRSESRGLHLT